MLFDRSLVLVPTPSRAGDGQRRPVAPGSRSTGTPGDGLEPGDAVVCTGQRPARPPRDVRRDTTSTRSCATKFGLAIAEALTRSGLSRQPLGVEPAPPAGGSASTGPRRVRHRSSTISRSCWSSWLSQNLGVIAVGPDPRARQGLVALTGETGAGKTMVVEALDLLLGRPGRPGSGATGRGRGRGRGTVRRRRRRSGCSGGSCRRRAGPGATSTASS